MNFARDLWDLPWHELQRSLAADFAAPAVAAGEKSSGSFRTAIEPPAIAALPAVSWLNRALESARSPQYPAIK